MIIELIERKYAAAVSLEGLKGRRVQVFHPEGDDITGLVTGVSEDGLNIQDSETHSVNGFPWARLDRVHVIG